MKVTIHTEREFSEEDLLSYARMLIQIGVPRAVVSDFMRKGVGVWIQTEPSGTVKSTYTREIENE